MNTKYTQLNRDTIQDRTGAMYENPTRAIPTTYRIKTVTVHIAVSETYGDFEKNQHVSEANIASAYIEQLLESNEYGEDGFRYTMLGKPTEVEMLPTVNPIPNSDPDNICKSCHRDISFGNFTHRCKEGDA